MCVLRTLDAIVTSIDWKLVDSRRALAKPLEEVFTAS